MIHRFSISNYHSVREEVVLDLRIPGTAPDLPCFRRSAVKPGVRLPTVVVLMGPNASGKTTLLRALVGAFEIASSGMGENRPPIRNLVPFFSDRFKGQPSRFWIEFETDQILSRETPRLFRYEFVVERIDTDSPLDAAFRYEALLHFPKGRPRRLFERRDPGKPVYLAGDFGLRPRDDRLKAIRPDVSLLSTLRTFGVPLATRIVDWMESKRGSSNIVAHKTWSLGTEQVIGMLEGLTVARDWIKSQIQASDLGIRDVVVRVGDAKEKFVMFEHDGLDLPLPLEIESSGTKRLFHLLPQIGMALNSTGTAVLDEIDGDLHVDIAGELLRWFRSRESNPRDAQLFVTSHNVGLLDDLDKEEVFIVEKDDSGATRVHGAQDVRGLRRDARLYAKYRGGVLGGLPRIG